MSHYYITAVKPVLGGDSKIGKTMVLKTGGSLMQVESIAECSDEPVPSQGVWAEMELDRSDSE